MFKEKIGRSRKKEVFWHISFWLLYFLIRVFIIKLYPGDLLFRLKAELVELPLKVAALYFIIFIMIEKLLLRRKYVKFIFVFITYVFVVMILNRVEDYFIIYPLTGSATTRYDAGFWNIEAAFLNLIYIYPVIGLAGAFYFVKRWYENQLHQEQLTREKREAELALLKTQLHPHFLFNTINNIYSLAQVTDKRVPDMMLRLADLLSFMLYDCNRDIIPLSMELRALSDYIELERLRLANRLTITFDVSGNPSNTLIAPLLLFPIVENCFKHASHKTSDVIVISIHIVTTVDEVSARIENSLPPASFETTATNNKSGIGLANLTHRLRLLYPEKHTMTIETNETYIVNLKVKWND